MSFTSFDIIHILSIFVQIPLIAVLLYKGGSRVSNKLMAFFFFAQILGSMEQLCRAHFDLTYEPYPYLAYIAIPFFTAWGPTMYLYVKAETEVDFRFRPIYLLHYLPLLFLTLYFVVFYHQHSIVEKRELLYSRELDFSFRKAFDLFIPIQVFLYNLFSIITIERFAKTNRSKSTTVLKRIRWNRFIIYGYFIACVCNNIAKTALLSGTDKDISAYLYISSILFFLYFAIILVNALMGSHFGGEIKKVRTLSMTQDEFSKLQHRLEAFMAKEKPYLLFNIGISDLAQSIGEKERQVSECINTHYHMTFQDYINSHRIAEAKRLIAKNKDSGKTILEIVYECGFNSKSAFNFAFKKHTDTTPTKYKKSLS